VGVWVEKTVVPDRPLSVYKKAIEIISSKNLEKKLYTLSIKLFEK